MIDPSRLYKIDKTKLFHSSGQAQAAQGQNIGSASQKILDAAVRQLHRAGKVNGYGYSRLGSSFNELKAKRADQSRAARRSFARNDPRTDSISSRQQSSASGSSPIKGAAPQRYTFKEPPSRGYNPYS